MRPEIERILPEVQKPARYVGGEYNEIIKDKSEVRTRIALCFPDIYEIGMSNLGMRILYGIYNNMPGVWCERVFAPWLDMEEKMRTNGIALYALESGDPVREFDFIAFSIGYEMAYTSVLNMLDLSGVPLHAREREDLHPIVIAGGECAFNAEPLADFIDLFIVGDGEDTNILITELYEKAKSEGWDKSRYLREASHITGVYVPSLYDIDYNEDGTIKSIKAMAGAPETVYKAVVQNFGTSYFPVKTIVPSTEIVHDRVVLELFRGCIRGCRFCQAGYVYRPVRSRSVNTLIEYGIQSLADSGYQEITLSSLSSSDYRGLGKLCDGLLDWCETRKISLSLPSLRADNFSMEIMQKVQKVRRSGLTFAPEAGSQRLRDVINKNVKEEELLNSCKVAFEGGWNSVKLYFMLGLPTETDEDVAAIADLAQKVLWTWKKHASNKSRGVRITVSTSCFVPKPHTPFQWEGQNSIDEFDRKQKLLRDCMRTKAITYNWHDPKTSYIEAILARGDRRISAVLEQVWRDGGHLDAWAESFSYERWIKAFEKCGVDPDFYALRKRPTDEILPWSMISTGVKKEYLINELKNAYKETITPDCRAQCTACGAERLYTGGHCDD